MDILTVDSHGNVCVTVPMYFRRVCGKKAMVVQDQTRRIDAVVKTNDPILVAYARAREFLKKVDEGHYRTVTELSDGYGMDRGNFSRDLGLALISPRIIHAIIDGTAPADITVNKLRMISSIDWAEQEREIGLAANF